MSRRLFAFAAVLSIQGSPVFDASGVDAFWRIQAQLAEGTEPSVAQWDALWVTPGYAALEAREKRRAALTQAMRFAFLPSLVKARDSVIATASFTGRATKHLMGVPAARDSIARFDAQLRRTGAIAVARRRVGDFVPKGLTASVSPPPIALTFFLDDGRGYPTVIVADLLRLTRTGIDTGYFAHEFYHFYRRRFASTRPEPPAADAGIAELLEYPAEEGLADQLDKRRYVDADSAAFEAMAARAGFPSYARGYRDAYLRSAEWMARVSRALERGVARPDSASAFARAMRDSIPDSGRALGAFMARAIDRTEGRAALISASIDAYDFWLRYEAIAARNASLPRLTNAARGVVRRMAERR